MSSYPPPPAGAVSAGPIEHDPQPHDQPLQSQVAQQPEPLVHADFDDAAAAAVAAATAAVNHHGLQALQVAVGSGAPPMASPVTPQYSSSAEPTPFLASNGPPVSIAPKATRLRRACDMCSQRKVKVLTN